MISSVEFVIPMKLMVKKYLVYRAGQKLPHSGFQAGIPIDRSVVIAGIGTSRSESIVLVVSSYLKAR